MDNADMPPRNHSLMVWRDNGLGSRLVVAALVALPVIAFADTAGTTAASGSSGSAGAGAPAPGSSPQQSGGSGQPAATAGLGGTGQSASPSPSPTENNSSSRRLNVDGLSFYPGFSGGCAAAEAMGGDFTQSTLLQPVQRLSGPARSRGRYINLSVAGSETYTDNLNHDPNGKSDWVTEVAPRLDACQSTGRIRGEFTYQLEGVAYANNSKYNDIYNDVRGNTTITLLPGHFYLDADTEYGQSVIDPSFGFSRSNALSPSKNKTNTWRTNVSPYLLQSLGPVGNAQVRYRYGQTRYTDPDVPDRSTNAVYVNINSPASRDFFTWNANFVSQEVKRDSSGNEARFYRRQGDNNFRNNSRNQDNRTTHFDRASLQLGLQVTDTLKLIGRGGVEDDYKRNGKNDRFSSPFWSAGFRWQSASNSLLAMYGHRFYGASYNVRAEHRGPNWDASLDYREEPTSQGRNSLNGGRNAGYSSFGPTNSLFDRGVYVDKRLTARINYETAFTTTTLSAYRQRRVYQTSGVDDDTNIGASIQTSYQIEPKTALVPRFDWQKGDGGSRGRRRGRRGGNSGGGYNTYDAGISAIHSLTPSLRVGLSYVREWRNSDRANDNYTENRVTMQFFKGF